MQRRTQQRLLLVSSGVLFSLSVGLVWLPFSPYWSANLLPLAIANSPTLVPRAEIPKELPSAKPQLTASQFEMFWKRPLRRVLYDPPPPPPPPPKIVETPPPRPILAKLMATMIEPGNSMAMLRLSTGEVVFRKQEDLVGAADADAKVSNIQEGVVTIERDKQTTKLTVDGQKGR